MRRGPEGGALTERRNEQSVLEVPGHVASLPGSPSRPSGAPAIVAGVIVVLSLVFLNIPYIALTPGPAENVVDLIVIKGAKTSPVSGRLLLTTVSLHEIKLGEAIIALFDPSSAIIPRSAFIPRGDTDKDVEQRTTQQMQESQVFAAAAALRYLGYTVPITPTGVRVEDVDPAAPAAAALHRGDVIVGADGATIRAGEEFRKAVHRHHVGDVISLRVVRGAKTVVLQTKTIARDPKAKTPDPIVGIITTDVPQVRLPLAVKIDSLGIGGPSAGLMFAVGIVDLLNHSDIAQNRIIAGTGEITVDGTVNPVGGVEQKVAGAKRAHAQLFLVPAAEADKACAVAGDLPVFAIENLKQAIAVLTNQAVASSRRCKP